MDSPEFSPIASFLLSPWNLILSICIFIGAVFYLKYKLVRLASNYGSGWGLSVLLLPIADLIFLIVHAGKGLKIFILGYLLLGLSLILFSSRCYLTHFYIPYHCAKTGEFRLIQKDKNHSNHTCLKFGIPNPECVLVSRSARLHDPQIRDLLVTFIASDCGNIIRQTSASYLKDLDVKVFWEDTSKQMIPKPRSLSGLKEEQISCSELWQIIIEGFWKDAVSISENFSREQSDLQAFNAKLPLRSDSDKLIRWFVLATMGFPSWGPVKLDKFGDPNLWQDQFPEYSNSSSYKIESKETYAANLIFIYMLHNELSMLPSRFKASIESPESRAIFFERMRRDKWSVKIK